MTGQPVESAPLPSVIGTAETAQVQGDDAKVTLGAEKPDAEDAK